MSRHLAHPDNGSEHWFSMRSSYQDWRLPMDITLELHLPNQPVCMVRTEEFSNSGASLIVDAANRPALGTQVALRVVGTLGADETPPLVTALVVAHTPEHIAVTFIEPLIY